ncbi:MAG: MBL fold metallo-hydrolase [Lachnospiraceae bacterium]|nr:MBL fold metallo-hydrolase [Lachnospiraceae bacterium]
MKLLKDIYLVGSGEFSISDAFDCHVYLIDGGEDAVLIDCGVGRSPERICKNVEEHLPLNRVSRVLLTHLHADHCGGAFYFQEQGIKVWAPRKEAEAIRSQPGEALEAFRLAKNGGCYPEDYAFPFIQEDAQIEDGQKIRVGRYTLEAMQLGGHSEGLLVYLLDTGDRRILFSSDYVFYHGCIGLLNCPGSELAGFRRDIKRLEGLGIEVLLPGHRMLALDGGQSHIEKAIENLSRAFVPPCF